MQSRPRLLPYAYADASADADTADSNANPTPALTPSPTPPPTPTPTPTMNTDPNTASAVTVGGRVLAANGKGINRADVTMTDGVGSSGQTSTDQTGSFSFANVEAGRNYTFTASKKASSVQKRNTDDLRHR